MYVYVFCVCLLVLAALVFEAVEVIHCTVNEFSTFSNAYSSRAPPPKFLFPFLDDSASCSSVILAVSDINADVTGFLKLQLVGIHRNCKRIPLPHFDIFLINYYTFKSF